jgi:hypothetical protein
MNALARALGVTLPEHAAGDEVVLAFDGMEVTFHEDDDGRAVVVTADIGEMPPDEKGVFAELALQANYSFLGTTALSLDAEAGELFATTTLPLALASADALSAAVESLVNTAEEWRRYATAFLDVDEEAAILKAEHDEVSPISGNHEFIRV